jgi:response regulator RpfG family c-di-GMP phosphodiesterase
MPSSYENCSCLPNSQYCGEVDLRNNESITILLVDDDPMIFDFVKGQISEYGYQPILVSSGEEALQVANQKTKLRFCPPIL